MKIIISQRAHSSLESLLHHLSPDCGAFHKAGASSNGPAMIPRPWWRYTYRPILVLRWLTLGTQIGISPCHPRLCSWRNGDGATSLPRLLLYCSARRTWHPESKGSGRRSWSFPQTPPNISNDQCSSRWLQSTSLPCGCTLSLPHLSIWSPQWTLLVYHWIEAHQGCERALVLIKSLERAQTNAHYKLLPW